MRLTLDVEEDLWPAQEKFYSEKEHLIVGYIGGCGSGKSYIGARKATELALVNKLCPGVISGPSLGQVMETAFPHLVEYLDTIGMPFYERRGQRPAVILPWGNPKRIGPGWILVRSLDKPGAIKGLNIGWAWVDEAGAVEKGEEAWQVLISRVRHPDATRKQVLLTGTGEAPWMKERFLDDDNDDYIFYKASTRENQALPENYVSTLERELPPHLREVYVDGGFMPPEFGNCYSHFSKDVHIRSDIKWNPALPAVHTLDFNVNPHCSLIGQAVQVDGHLSAVVHDEIVIPNGTTYDAVERFLSKLGLHKGGVEVYGDPSGTHRTTSSKLSDYAIIRKAYTEKYGVEKASFYYRMSDPGIRTRINCVNAMLRNSLGDVRLYVHKRCRNLIYDLLNVAWKDDGTIDKTKVNKQTGWTVSHTSDALAYWIERAFPILRPVITN
jgi:hypothetical protein